MILCGARPLQAAFLDPRIADSRACVPYGPHFVPDLLRALKGKTMLVPHCAGDCAYDLPVRTRFAPWLDYFPDALHAALRVHERTVFFERRCRRQKDRAELLSRLVPQ